jgi:hypothetical protein
MPLLWELHLPEVEPPIQAEKLPEISSDILAEAPQAELTMSIVRRYNWGEWQLSSPALARRSGRTNQCKECRIGQVTGF